MGDNDLLMAILMTLQYLERQRDYQSGALKANGLTTERPSPHAMRLISASGR